MGRGALPLRASCLLAVVVALTGCGRTPWVFGAGGGDGDGADDPGTTSITPGDADGPGQTATSVTPEPTSTTIGPDDDSTSTGIPSCADAPELCSTQISLRRAVDILFVVDNSGSMGGEQGTLAQSFASFIDVLEDQQVGANYRIGVTTTSGSGLLRATSCRGRLNEFLFSWQFGDLDERQRGCLDNCTIDSINIPQPWVEKSDGQTNLPPGIGMAQALQCIGPQGINGPGLERPLESMRNTLQGNSQGFMRDDALLAVIFLTDEADCSMSDANVSWISNSGTVFWSTPERATSAVCWNAGVDCTGGPGVYAECHSQDHAMNGQATNDPDQAVVYPVQRYIDVLTDIAEQKQISGGQGEVLVAVIGGVPLDYPDTGVLVYQDSLDPDFNIEFGIGPGCGFGTESITNVPGIPPVRLRELAEAFATDERNLFSICDDDYGVALTQIADAIGEINERACINGCVEDAEPAPGLQPNCSLVQTFADDMPDAIVPPCLVFDDGWDFPAPDVHACWRGLTDVAGTTPPLVDDMSAQCQTVGSNLEFVIERRVGVPIPAGTSIEVKCELLFPVGITCDEG